jgi:predicted nucleotidyltransferase
MEALPSRYNTDERKGTRNRMSIEQRLKQRREEVLQIASKHGARNIRIFGSIARGDADPSSDVDLLVELEPGRSLLDLGGLQYELEVLLGCPVDVVTAASLKPRVRARVLQEAEPL